MTFTMATSTSLPPSGISRLSILEETVHNAFPSVSGGSSGKKPPTSGTSHVTSSGVLPAATAAATAAAQSSGKVIPVSVEIASKTQS
ncbi:hypothetical protein [Cytobacillus pseudoceanisediminis]